MWASFTASGLTKFAHQDPASDPQFVQFCWLNCGMRFVLFSWELFLLLIICFKIHSLRYMVFTVFTYCTFKKKNVGFFFDKMIWKFHIIKDRNWGSATLWNLPFISLNSDCHWDGMPKCHIKNKYIFLKWRRLSVAWNSRFLDFSAKSSWLLFAVLMALFVYRWVGFICVTEYICYQMKFF